MLRELTTRAHAGLCDPGALPTKPLALRQRGDSTPMVQCHRCDAYTHELTTSGLCWMCDLGWRNCPIHGQRERYGAGHNPISISEALAEIRPAPPAEPPVIANLEKLRDGLAVPGNPRVMIRNLSRGKEHDMCSVIVQNDVLYIQYLEGSGDNA